MFWPLISLVGFVMHTRVVSLRSAFRRALDVSNVMLDARIAVMPYRAGLWLRQRRIYCLVCAEPGTRLLSKRVSLVCVS